MRWHKCRLYSCICIPRRIGRSDMKLCLSSTALLVAICCIYNCRLLAPNPNFHSSKGCLPLPIVCSFIHASDSCMGLPCACPWCPCVQSWCGHSACRRDLCLLPEEALLSVSCLLASLGETTFGLHDISSPARSCSSFPTINTTQQPDDIIPCCQLTC